MLLKLQGMKLGVATASAQIEGGQVGSNWNHYSDQGKIIDGSNIRRAADHWNRYEEDIQLLVDLGIKDYRMSIEWARLEPEPGRFDSQVMDRYRQEIQLMKDQGIEVLLTLHHFSHPQWFEDLGGFEKAQNLSYFLAFVSYLLDHLDDLVSDYCTINEPNVYATQGYLFGEWLQEEKSLKKTLHVMSVLATCHIETYQLIHQHYQDKGLAKPQVTFALNYRHFEPYSSLPHDKLGAKVLHYLYQEALFKAFALGQFAFPLKNLHRLPKGQYCDMIGINYYTRGLVKDFGDVTKAVTQKNDLGWEIFPQGIAIACQRLYDILPLPIRITENGTCDNSDDFRCRYLYDHLQALVQSHLPITHYYHWCFTDNFEWKEGERPRFGLIHVDYQTQKRTIKQSGYFYQTMIQDGGVSQEAYDTYVSPQAYHHGERNILSDLLSPEELRNRR